MIYWSPSLQLLETVLDKGCDINQVLDGAQVRAQIRI